MYNELQTKQKVLGITSESINSNKTAATEQRTHSHTAEHKLGSFWYHQLTSHTIKLIQRFTTKLKQQNKLHPFHKRITHGIFSAILLIIIDNNITCTACK